MLQTAAETDVTLTPLEGCACALCNNGHAVDPGAEFAEQTARRASQDYDQNTGDADQNIDALLTGSKWATTSLTYSFPDSASDYSYVGYLNVRDSFQPMNVAQEAAARAALDFYESVSGLRFTELDGPSDADADLMFAMSDAPPTAFAYYPSSSDAGGDSWFNTRNYNNPEAGNYAWSTFLHEVGHALGLKHGHETNGPGAIEAAFDSHEYSLMTYRSYVGSAGTAYTNGTWSGPQTAMMLDIAAIQRMYGANYDHASGDTVYTFSTATGQMFENGVGATQPGGNYILRTVWDGGGFDTYNFSNYSRDLIVDLSPGGYVDLDANGNAQRAYLGGGQYAKGHVFNAMLHEGDTRSLIEAAIGGSRNDLLIGNQADNRLEGGAGADTLAGLAGSDTLIGGAGADRFLFDLDLAGNGDSDLILDLNFAEGDVLDLSGFGAGAFLGFGFDGSVQGDGAVLASSADLSRAGSTDFLTLSATDLGGTMLSFAEGALVATVVLASVNFAGLPPLVGLTGLPGPDVPTPLPDPVAVPVDNRLQIGTNDRDLLTGGNEADTLYGGGASDTLLGGAGNDAARGGEGNDILRGHSGRDRLWGDNGNDRLVGNDDQDRLVGGAGRDKLFGSDGVDKLFGGSDVDWLFGGDDSDYLFGGSGRDRLKGEDGNDRLEGGSGVDTLEGGAGADRFIFKGKSGVDKISDFGRGKDKMLISSADDLSDLRIVSIGNDVVVVHRGGKIILEDVDLSEITAGDFIF